MNETPLYFDGSRARLFGVLHDAAESSTRLPFVFCHPFAEEKLWTHRVFVSFARELARRGHSVLRFDYLGNGDSEGSFEQSSVASALEDIGSAVELLKVRSGRAEVGLLGLRLGATYAALTAEARDDVAALVLWAPILDGARYAQELLRINLTTQMAVYREIRSDREALAQSLAAGATVNVDGYEMALPLYEGLNRIQLHVQEAARFRGPCLILQVERRLPARVNPDLGNLAGAYAAGSLQIVQEEPFWKEIPRFYQEAIELAHATLTWLEDR